MAFSWSSTPSVGGKISANEVNEVRDLINTMHSNLQCSARQAVVYASHNDGYQASKYDSKQACSTVYGARYSNYCATVQGSYTQNTCTNNAIAATCPNNNSTQYSNNTCTQNDSSDRTSTYISDNSSNDSDLCDTDNWGDYNYHDSSEYEDYDFCSWYQYDCNSDYFDVWDYQFSGERYTYENYNCDADDWGEYYSDNDTYNEYNRTTNWNTQHLGNYASKVTCSARQSSYYSGRQTSQWSTVYSGKYICSAQHGTYGN